MGGLSGSAKSGQTGGIGGSGGINLDNAKLQGAPKSMKNS